MMANGNRVCLFSLELSNKLTEKSTKISPSQQRETVRFHVSNVSNVTKVTTTKISKADVGSLIVHMLSTVFRTFVKVRSEA